MNDKAVFARSAGKQSVEARTVWKLEIGPIRFRCVVDGDECVVQSRTDKGWKDMGQ